MYIWTSLKQILWTTSKFYVNSIYIMCMYISSKCREKGVGQGIGSRGGNGEYKAGNGEKGREWGVGQRMGSRAGNGE